MKRPAHIDLDGAVGAARDRYIRSRPRSAVLAAVAAEVLPGGNTRSVLDFDPYPFRVARADGPVLVDVDGHRYVDLLGNYTAGLLGHRPEPVRDAVVSALDRGWSLGAMKENEAELARLVSARFPSIDQVRFTNSGTEANLMAIASAVNHTDRRKVLVFRGGYHGGVLYFGPAGRSLNVPHDWVFADFNDPDSTDAAFTSHPDSLAAVLVEPMMGAGGCLPGDPGWLDLLRRRCDEAGAVLIFDEVMTSRLATGGAQQLLGVTPDMTTLGKYLGGGLTFGAFGGRRDIMGQFDPRHGAPLSHGGTFNNNELTMAAGVAALSLVLTSDALAEINARGDALRGRLDEVLSRAGLPMGVTGWGSLMNIHGTSGPVTAPADLDGADGRWVELLFLALLEAGFYIARRGFIALSLDITDDHADRFVAAVETWTNSAASVS